LHKAGRRRRNRRTLLPIYIQQGIVQLKRLYASRFFALASKGKQPQQALT
jgi:hypothetical protein